MPNTPVQFTGHRGTPLSGNLELPETTPRGFALFAHCFTCSKDSRAAAYISRALARRGFAVLRFDFTGLGASHGDFSNTNFSSNVEDLVYAAEFLQQHYQAPKLLIGHSLGGAAAVAAAARLPGVEAIVTLNAPATPQHVEKLLSPSVDRLQEQGSATVSLGGRKFTIERQFLDDIRSVKLADSLKHTQAALLVLHAPTDSIVGIENARVLFEAAHHPKSFVALPGADHLLSKRSDAEYVASVLSAWASRYLAGAEANDNSAQKESATDPDPPAGVVRVMESGRSRFEQDITAGRHHWLADEPHAVGGKDTGPNPYELLSAALGACTTMTLRMYADRKGWPLEHVSVDLSHSKIHADVCQTCETQTGLVDQIERKLRFTGPLSDEQRARLLEIADKCPVHRTLHSEVNVKTTLLSD